MPAELEPDDAGQDLFGPMFDPAQISRLYTAGWQMARDRSAWHEGSPRVDDDPMPGEMASISHVGRQ